MNICTKCLFGVALIFSLILPITVSAGVIEAIYNLFSGDSKEETKVETLNSQNIPLLASVANFDSKAAIGGGDIAISTNKEALIAESGPSGTQANIGESVSTGQISKYVVREGDNLSSIAKMHGVSTNTIIWANNLTTVNIKIGQSLVILPVSGTIHTVVKGDTLQTIAKKYKGDVGEIAQFNGLKASDSLTIGEDIIIPDGEGSIKVSTNARVATNLYKGGSGPSYVGYYMRPVIGGVKTQGLHGYNGIDIGLPTGSTLFASAAGQVIIARNSGWNGGYGKYIVISHYNGTQTVYGHLSEVLAYEGQTVAQGQVIGLTGNTGKSTGPHLHFEVRGAKNPF
jgi:LysM repeat protein